MSDWANQLVETRRNESRSGRELHKAHLKNFAIIRSLHEAILAFIRRLPREIRVAVTDDSSWKDSSSFYNNFDLIYCAFFPLSSGRRELKQFERFGALLAELDGSLDCVKECETPPIFRVEKPSGGHLVQWGSNMFGSAPWATGTGFYLAGPTEKTFTHLSFLEKVVHAGKARRCEETKTWCEFSALSNGEIDSILRSVIENRAFAPATLAFGTVRKDQHTSLV